MTQHSIKIPDWLEEMIGLDEKSLKEVSASKTDRFHELLMKGFRYEQEHSINSTLEQSKNQKKNGEPREIPTGHTLHTMPVEELISHALDFRSST